MFGPQAGFDVWWNVIPGINFGFGMKGAWVHNEVDRRTVLRANSLGPLPEDGIAVIDSGSRDTTVIGELETKVVYRLSHSWSLRSSYYLVGIDNARFATVDLDTIRNFVDPLNNPAAEEIFGVRDLVIQGFTFGAEYIW